MCDEFQRPQIVAWISNGWERDAVGLFDLLDFQNYDRIDGGDAHLDHLILANPMHVS